MLAVSLLTVEVFHQVFDFVLVSSRKQTLNQHILFRLVNIAHSVLLFLTTN